MKLNLSLKTLAWSWGVLLTAGAAGAVALQVVDVVPPPETPPVLQALTPAAAQPTPVLFAAAADKAPVPAAPAATKAAVPEAPKPHPPRQEAALPVPPIPPRVVHETREARNWRHPIMRAYAAEPQWQPAMAQPYWRGSPYPGQYYAYSEPYAYREPAGGMQGPPSYYPWPPAD